MSTMETETGKMSIWLALLPVVVLMGIISANVFIDKYYFDDPDESFGSNQIALLLGSFVAGGIGLARGTSWKTISEAIAKSISQSTEAMIILLLIGALSGTWLLAGITPAFIHYGLQLLNPSIFLFAACIVSAALSLATGSSWATIGTIGVALIGIGTMMGIEEGWVAGAIISGAYFGDKLSPLSDTTNLAPAVAGTDLITHIKYMTITTVPSITVALAVFLIVGLTGDASSATEASFAEGFADAVESTFKIHLGLFIAPIAVLVMIAKKIPAAPSLFIGVLLGALTAVIFQPEAVKNIAGEDMGYLSASYVASSTSMALDTAFNTGNEYADKLMRSGGMKGMLDTIWLIICAMIFGAVLQAGGMLKRITEGLIASVNSVFGLIGRTAGTSIAFNILASDQYIAILVPGKMFRDEYKKHNLAPENLSRTLEDAGTATSVLIPWNTCGLAQSEVLNVATLAYAPYCIFNWLSPVMSLIVAKLGYKLNYTDK